MLGYAAHPRAGPGRAGGGRRGAHHVLLSHGLGVDVLRGTVRADAEIAVTFNPYPVSRRARTSAIRTPPAGWTASPTASGTTRCCGASTRRRPRRLSSVSDLPTSATAT